MPDGRAIAIIRLGNFIAPSAAVAFRRQTRRHSGERFSDQLMRTAVLTMTFAAALHAAPAVPAPQTAATGGLISASFEQVRGWVASYKAAHSGNQGKDWDINAKSPAEIGADPAAQRLLALCGKDQRPVIPLLAWEYGGFDHQWINPGKAALVYCVYTPMSSPSPHWRYDAREDEVTADVYVKFPDQNPCRGEPGANQVIACIGDRSNFEILVDTASLNDGHDVGLSLASASTMLKLLMPDGSRTHLWLDR
jgi:hypothetical protein